jgi:hypothetical protein
VALLIGHRQTDGLPATYASAAAVCLLLLPVCAWWYRVKAAHPATVARYV